MDDFTALYNFYLPGFNLRSTDLQAFIGLMAVDKLDEYSRLRNKNFNLYLNNISNSKLNLEIREDDYISNFAFPVVCDNKNEVVKRLIENNIEVRPLIAGDMSKKPMWYEQYGKLSLRNSETINEFGFYVPNHQDLTEEEIIKICKIINNE